MLIIHNNHLILKCILQHYVKVKLVLNLYSNNLGMFLNQNFCLMQNNTILKVLNFADDTMLYKTFTKDTYLNDSKTFNTELKKVSDWLWETNLN